MFKARRRRPLSLIELLIGMSLLAVLMSVLYGVYGQVHTLQGQIEKVRKESFHWRYVKSRLMQVLPYSKLPPERGAFFVEAPFSESPQISLVFTRDNEVDIRPEFSGMVLSRLYVDTQKRLCLATWPEAVDGANYQMQREVLIEGVDSLQLSFYKPPEGLRVDRESGWLSEWDREEKDLPPLLRVQVKMEDGREALYSFILSFSKNTIKYYM